MGSVSAGVSGLIVGVVVGLIPSSLRHCYKEEIITVNYKNNYKDTSIHTVSYLFKQ